MMIVRTPLDVFFVLVGVVMYCFVALLVIGAVLSVIDLILPGSPLGIQSWARDNPQECHVARC